MFSLFKRMIDADRLSKELDEAEERISYLEKQLAAAGSGPDFRMVAKEFDASQIHDMIKERVIKDLSPMLKREAIRFLEDGLRDLRPNYPGPSMIGYAAMVDTEIEIAAFEFRVPEMGTRVQGAFLQKSQRLEKTI